MADELQAQTPQLDTSQQEVQYPQQKPEEVLTGGVNVQALNPLPNWISPKIWKQTVDSVMYVGSGYEMAEDDVSRSIGGHKAYLGLTTVEEAKLRYHPDAVKQRRNQAVQMLDDQHIGDWLWAAKSIYSAGPALKFMAQDAFAMGTAGIAIGAPAGAVIGGESSLVGLPFMAPISVPAGAGAGALVGGVTGGARGIWGGLMHSAFVLGSGSTMMDLVDQDVNPATARAAATASGTIGVVLQRWFLGNSVKQLVPLYQQAMQKTFLQVLKEAGILGIKGVVAADVTAASQYAIEAAAMYIDQGKPIKWDDIRKGMIKAHATGVLQGAVAAITHTTLSGRLYIRKGETKGPVLQSMKAIMDNVPQNVAAKEAVLATKKFELSVIKAEDAISKAQTAISEAKAEGASTKVPQAQLEVAQAQLEVLKPQESPIKLEGQITKAAPMSAPKDHQALQKEIWDEIGSVQEDLHNAEEKLGRINREIKLKTEEKVALPTEDYPYESVISKKITLTENNPMKVEQRELQAEIKKLRQQEKHLFEDVSDPLKKLSDKRRQLEVSISKLDHKIEKRMRWNPLDKHDHDIVARNLAKEELTLYKEVEKEMFNDLKKQELKNADATKTKIDKLLARAVIPRGKNPNLPTSPQAIRILGVYKQGIYNQAEAIKSVNDTPLVPESVEAGSELELERQFIYNQVAGYDNFNNAQLTALHNQIKDVFLQGKIERADKLLRVKANLEKFSNRFQNGVRGGWTDEEIALYKVNPDWKKKNFDKIRTIGHTVAVWDEVVDMVIQDAPEAERTALREALSFTQAEMNEQADINYWISEFKNAASGGTELGMKSIDKFLTKLANKEHFGYYTHKTLTPMGKGKGKKSPLNEVTFDSRVLAMSTDDLINLRVQLDDKDARAGFEKMGYTYADDPDLLPGVISFEQAVRNAVASIPEAEAISQAVKLMNKRHGREYASPVHEERSGIPLNLDNENWSGYLARDIPGAPEELNLMASAIDRMGLTPNSTIDRTNNSHRIRQEGAVVKLIRMFTEYAHYKHMTEPAQLATATFSNPATRKMINDKFPTTLLETIDDAYKTIIGTKAKNKIIAFRWLTKTRIAMGTAATGMKPISYVAQWTAFNYYAHFMPSKDLLAGIAYAELHPSEVDAIMTPTKFIQGREEDLKRTVLNATRGEESIVHNAFTDKSMWFVKSGDLNVLKNAGYSYYRWYRENVATGTGLERHKQAIEAFENASVSTQSSSYLSQQTQYEREGEVGRSWGTFKKQVTQLNAFISRAARNVYNDPSFQNCEKLARAVRINLSTALMFFTVKQLGKVLGATAITSVFGLILHRKMQQDTDWYGIFLNAATDAFTDMFSNLPVTGPWLEYAVRQSANMVREDLKMPKGNKPFEPTGGIGPDQIGAVVKGIGKTQTILNDKLMKDKDPTIGDITENLHQYAQGAPVAGSRFPFVPITGTLKAGTKDEKKNGKSVPKTSKVTGVRP